MKIKLPNQETLVIEQTEVTIYEAAALIAKSLAKNAIAGRVNDVLLPLTAQLKDGDQLKIVTSTDGIKTRLAQYTTGLITALALKMSFPHVNIVDVKADFDSFYVDFQAEPTLKASDLQAVNINIKKIKKTAFKKWQLVTTNPKAALAFNPWLTNNDLQNQQIFYHPDQNVTLASPKLVPIPYRYINYWELTSLTGAYWQNQADQLMLQRLHGFGTSDEALFVQIKNRHEIALATDHRNINKKLDLFMFSPLVGQGLPLLLPAAIKIKNKIMNYIRQKEAEYDFLPVETPVLAQRKMYEMSGHLSHYEDSMFPAIKAGNETLILRPMACPHHIMIYKHYHPVSYRDLPIRFAEAAMLHRYEASGGLTGLERVRVMSLTDAHIFVRTDQIKHEFIRCFRLINGILADFRIKVDYLALALRDPNNTDKYYQDNTMWHTAEKMIRQALDEIGVEYQDQIGEAAFYGPKIDVQILNAQGHEITLATIQLDFLMPRKFGLTYIDENQQSQCPIMIHRSLIGTYERFLAIIIEQNKGLLPFWLCPDQIVIIPVNNAAHLLFCQEIAYTFKKLGISVRIDDSDERLGYKVRQAQMKAIPYLITIGDDEIKHHHLAVRRRSDNQIKKYSIAQFKRIISSMIRSKR